MRPRSRPPGKARQAPAASTSWDALATWYNGWVGEGGSEHHRKVAVPAVISLLDPVAGEEVLDIGCGQGVLAPSVASVQAHYTGIDASPRLIQAAKRHHGGKGRYLVGNALRLRDVPGVEAGAFDAAVFLLSLQDMDPLQSALESAAWALRPGGRVVLLLTHPAFRVPRQSGWGWDEDRKLMYRRIDRYLSPLPVPMKSLPGKDAGRTTRSFHRPLSAYVNGLGACSLLVDRFEEIPGLKGAAGAPTPRADRLAREEIPLFLGIRARKVI